MSDRTLRAGTTLIELLIAVTFMALCASSILTTVVTANTQASYALRRAAVLAVLQDRIETARGAASAMGSSMTPGTTPGSYTLSGFVGPITTSTVVSQRTNSRTLYDIIVSATWTEETSLGTRTDTASLATLIKH